MFMLPSARWLLCFSPSSRCLRLVMLPSLRISFVRAPTTPGALLAVSRLAGQHGPSSLTEWITQSWTRAHQTRFAAKVSKLESRRPPRSNSFLLWCLLLRAYHAPGHQPLAFPPLLYLPLPFHWLSPPPWAAATAGDGPPHSAMYPASGLPWRSPGLIDTSYLFLCPCPSKQNRAFRQLHSRTLRALGHRWCLSLLHLILPRAPTSSRSFNWSTSSGG